MAKECIGVNLDRTTYNAVVVDRHPSVFIEMPKYIIRTVKLKTLFLLKN